MQCSTNFLGPWGKHYQLHKFSDCIPFSRYVAFSNLSFIVHCPAPKISFFGQTSLFLAAPSLHKANTRQAVPQPFSKQQRNITHTIYCQKQGFPLIVACITNAVHHCKFITLISPISLKLRASDQRSQLLPGNRRMGFWLKILTDVVQ